MGTVGFKGRPIVVALALEPEKDRPALDAAMALGRRMACHLRLVHVVSPSYPLVWSAGIDQLIPNVNLAEEITEQARRNAEAGLEAAKKACLTASLQATTHVLVGSAVETISADAVASGAGLILCSSVLRPTRWIPRGLSVPLGLMAQGGTAVLVVGAEGPFATSGTAPHVVVADDLGDGGLDALTGGAEFALATGATSLTHLHVSALDSETVALTLQNIAASGRLRSDPRVVAGDLHKTMLEATARQLKERQSRLASSGTALMTNKIAINTEVRVGNPGEEINQVVEKQRADGAPVVAVFGRHHVFHRKPFTLGQMPYWEMLANKAAVLVLGRSH